MVFTIKERQEFGSPNFINVVNLVFRFCQIVLCAAVIGIYAPAVSDPLWRDHHGKMILAGACGAISLAVAVIFAAIPFLISYYYVAVFFILELIIMFIWISVQVKQQQFFGNKQDTDSYKRFGVRGVDTLIAVQWIDLTCLLLFLTTSLMSMVCLGLDWRGRAHANRGAA